MRKTQRLARTSLVTLVLFPIHTWGQEKQVVHELGAMVATRTPVELANKPVTVRIGMQGSRAQIESAMAPSSKTALALIVDGIDFDKIPGVYYEVYVGLPTNEAHSYKSVYFVGNLALFQPPSGGSGGHASHPSSVSFDITKTVRALKSFKSWNDATLTVTFVARGHVDRKGRQIPVPPGVGVHFTGAKVVTITPET